MPLVKKNMNGCKISCTDTKLPLLPQALDSECTSLAFSPSNSNTLGARVRKGSVRGTKLALRARSFKDDFLEKLSQIRTPTNTIARSQSPNSPKMKQNLKDLQQYDSKTTQDLNYHVRQVKHALTHFKDVIMKKKLEMLHGNGTVVLESITNVHIALKSYNLNEYSSALISSTQQVHLALAKLIKLCDEVLLCENEETCSSLNQENVTEIVLLVENAVQNLVILANEKIAESSNASSKKADLCNSVQSSVMSTISLRTSLPDIPLTQRERDIMEQTAVTKQKLRTSNSTESVVRNTPPSKPTKMRSSINLPPPLPPKTAIENSNSKVLIHNLSSLTLNDCYFDNNFFLLCNSSNTDRVTPLSRSCEESFDQISIKFSKSDLLKQSNIEMSNNCQMVINTNNLDSSGFIQIEQFSSNESGSTSMASHCSNKASTNTNSEPNVFSEDCHLNISNKTRMRQQSKTIFMDNSDNPLSSSNNINQNYNQIMNNPYLISDDMIENMEDDTVFLRKNDVNDLPPPLPVKTRNSKFRSQRQDSQYDNVEDFLDHNTATTASSSSSSITSVVPLSFISKSNFDKNNVLKNKYTSCIEPRHFNNFNHGSLNNEQPPPLPMKKKHMFQSVAYSVMAYMEIFGNSQHYAQDTSKETKIVRHSMHTVSQSLDIKTHVVQQQNITLNLSQTISLNSPPASPNNEIKPPLLPPKRTRNNSFNRKPNSSTTEQCPKLLIETRFDSLKKHHNTVESNNSEQIRITENTKEISEESGILNSFKEIFSDNNSNNFKHEPNDNQVVLRQKLYKSTSPIRNLTEETDIRKYLVLKKKHEDGPDIKGGQIDVLIVHATKVQKFSEAFGEAFLTTYRTFINPYDLIDKLTKRYIFFQCQINDDKQRAAKESFSLLVRVVNDLTFPDLNTSLMQKLVDFVYQLVCFGELLMAKLLRVKLIEKASILKQKRKQLLVANYLPSRPIMSTPPCLLDLKSTDIAEQMTLLDAQLFFKIEIPEVLIWAREQNEESSPNLTLFTEHFNKMSYWARTQILKQQEAKDREKFVFKFIKIMKHLRKINNYNSYLALLSALDSAPIRRLEWQKTITEGLKEYCALIDSSSSFRAYRQALSETNPPCIPYIGLVLQDLTFVDVGNNDYLEDGVDAVNFSKRWQQYNIVVNMKRFRKGAYGFKKNERIIGFFDNFEDYFDEDAMWQISEKIKPRGIKK